MAYKAYHIISFLLAVLIAVSCNGPEQEPTESADIVEIVEGDLITAVIEIPVGTNEKWEMNKETGEIEWDTKDGKPRVINYLGYPGNYGFVPETILSKNNGGDGDPLDILVIGPAVDRGDSVQCQIVGVLQLLDGGEQDDKLIAIANDSPIFGVQDMTELDEQYPGISEIIKIWFLNYKGPGKMEDSGYASASKAYEILQKAKEEYRN